MRWTRRCAGDAHRGGRSSRVVLSPRRWGQADRDDRSATEANKPDTPGRSRSSRKEPSRRECRMFRPTCSDYLLVRRLPVFAYEAAGAPAPGIPCALGLRERRLMHHSGAKSRRGNAVSCLLRCRRPRRRATQHPRGFSVQALLSLEYGSPGQGRATTAECSAKAPVSPPMPRR